MASVTLRMMVGMGLAAGGLAVGAPAANAAAGVPGPETMIKLSVVPQLWGQPRTATLTCDPAGGTHPNAKLACAELAAVDGDIARVPTQPGRRCLTVWIPVDASATGTWRGKPIKYFETFANDGCARIAHGHVLDF